MIGSSDSLCGPSVPDLLLHPVRSLNSSIQTVALLLTGGFSYFSANQSTSCHSGDKTMDNFSWLLTQRSSLQLVVSVNLTSVVLFCKHLCTNQLSKHRIGLTVVIQHRPTPVVECPPLGGPALVLQHRPSAVYRCRYIHS